MDLCAKERQRGKKLLLWWFCYQVFSKIANTAISAVVSYKVQQQRPEESVTPLGK